jgi:hypothetical protein
VLDVVRHEVAHREAVVGRDDVDRREGAAALELATRNGLDDLYVFTESAEDMFRRHGFVYFDDAVTNGCPITILRREL